MNMSNEPNDSNSFSFWTDSDQLLYYNIQFWIFLCFSLANIPCSILVLHHYLTQRDHRYTLHNYTNFIIIPINLFYQLTNITFYLHFFRTFELLSTSRIFRLIWGYIDWTFFAMQVILFAWATVEKHILIFHDQLLLNRKRRIILHYSPPILIVLYSVIYYTVVIFGSNCENIDPDDRSSSFYPCGFQNRELYIYETIANQILPNFVIVLASLFLLIRIVWQKYRRHHQFRWRQHRQMTVQLLSIAFLYLVLATPHSFVIFLYLVGMPSTIAGDFIQYSLFCLYYVLLLHPVVCAASLPNLRKKFRNLYHRSTTVEPWNRTETHTRGLPMIVR